MDYEKKYKNAVEEIRKLRAVLIAEGIIHRNGMIDYNFNRIFPELNEDEIIRGNIINHYALLDTPFDSNGIPKEKYIEWLERH